MSDKTNLSRDAAMMAVMALSRECTEISEMIQAIHGSLLDDTVTAMKAGKKEVDYTTILRMNRNQATALIALFTYGADAILSEIDSLKGEK